MATLSQTSSGLDVSGGTSGTLSLTSVASGSLMIVVVCDADANAVTFAVTDDIGNDWRRAVGKSGTEWALRNMVLPECHRGFTDNNRYGVQFDNLYRPCSGMDGQRRDVDARHDERRQLDTGAVRNESRHVWQCGAH